jgi:cytosine/adenosine deaminase-related metal-dependent hydrolase
LKRKLLKNCSWIVTLDEKSTIHKNTDILIEDNKIKEIGSNLRYEADEYDCAGKLAMPGMVNTHHHLYQTLTRCVPRVQDAELFEWLTNLYEIWRELTPEAVYWSTLLGLGELALTGCTTSTDMLYLFPKQTSGELIDQQFKASKELGMRFVPCRGSMSCGRSEGGLPPDDVVQDPDTIHADSERLIKKYHDKDPFAMTRLALGPCSPFSVSPQLMKETAQLARKHGVRLHTHLAETKDEEKYCAEKFNMRPFELMESIDWVGKDVWFAHSIYVHDREIRRMGETGTGVAHCPVSNLRLGSGIAPVPEMLAAGVPVSFAVDGSASNDSSDMLGEIRTGLLVHRYRSGTTSMTAEETLRIACQGGAKVLGYDTIGTLAPGMAADIVLINMHQMPYAGALHDPMAAVVLAGANHIVDATIINGEVVVWQGHLTKVEESEIIFNTNRIASEMVERAKKRTGIDFLSKPTLMA